jgi:hypothetical protein
MTYRYRWHSVDDLRFDLVKIDSDQSGLDAMSGDLSAGNPPADSLLRDAVMLGSSSNGTILGM